MNTPVTLDRARPDDYAQMLAVWEASVRATHHFLTEADIQFFKPLVRDAFAPGLSLVCVRDDRNQVISFANVRRLISYPGPLRRSDFPFHRAGR